MPFFEIAGVDSQFDTLSTDPDTNPCHTTVDQSTALVTPVQTYISCTEHRRSARFIWDIKKQNLKVGTHISRWVLLYVCVNVCKFVCMYVCMYVGR